MSYPHWNQGECIQAISDRLAESITDDATFDVAWAALGQVVRCLYRRPPAQASASVSPDPDPHEMAVELGRRGGQTGGLARARSLSPQRRSEIARQAANARWNREEVCPHCEWKFSTWALLKLHVEGKHGRTITQVAT